MLKLDNQITNIFQDFKFYVTDKYTIKNIQTRSKKCKTVTQNCTMVSFLNSKFCVSELTLNHGNGVVFYLRVISHRNLFSLLTLPLQIKIQITLNYHSDSIYLFFLNFCFFNIFVKISATCDCVDI